MHNRSSSVWTELPNYRALSSGRVQSSMRTVLLVLILPIALIAVFPAASAVSQTRAETRAVAVTFDDLPAPAAGMVANDVAGLTAMTRNCWTPCEAMVFRRWDL